MHVCVERPRLRPYLVHGLALQRIVLQPHLPLIVHLNRSVLAVNR